MPSPMTDFRSISLLTLVIRLGRVWALASGLACGRRLRSLARLTIDADHGSAHGQRAVLGVRTGQQHLSDAWAFSLAL